MSADFLAELGRQRNVEITPNITGLLLPKGHSFPNPVQQTSKENRDFQSNPHSILAKAVQKMADLTREEIDAKLDASEARTDTKIARMEGKLDLVISKLDAVNSRIDDVRDDYRATRSNQWVIGLGLAAIILACAFGLPTIFGFGTQFRDIIHSEVQSSLTATKPTAQ